MAEARRNLAGKGPATIGALDELLAHIRLDHGHSGGPYPESRMQRRYKVVDVFTDRPLGGNPVAVVLDAEGLDTATMQSIAAWTNLSETTFALPPTTAGADYRLRIFTPGSELPFAGHPTLGSLHALREAGRVTAPEGRAVQQCGVGLVALAVATPPAGAGDSAGRVAPSAVQLELPPATIRPLSAVDVAELQFALGLPCDAGPTPAIVNVGPQWIIARYASAQQVLALRPDFARLAELERRLGVTGATVYGPQPAGSDSAIEVRSFAPSSGVAEDPVCGSGNGSVAAFQRALGLLPAAPTAYVAAQGQCVGRNGRVAVHFAADGAIWLGGSCVTCVDGVLELGEA